MITHRQVRRLKRLVERRLKEFEELLAGRRPDTSFVEFEKQSRALITLVKALQEAAALEARLPAGETQRKRRKAERTNDDLRRGLARRLEALLAETEPPRPARCPDAGTEGAGGADLAADRTG